MLGHHVGAPVTGNRHWLVLSVCVVGHQVDQVVTGGQVAVQRGRPGAQLGGHAAHRHRRRPIGVRDRGHCAINDR
jgi:hypothetical protein